MGLTMRAQKLQRNPTLLFWGKALSEINALNAIITLFYLHRGITIDQIFYLSIFWSLTSLVLEVPTGYLADRFGRKCTLLLGVLLLVLSYIVMWSAHGFPAFIGVLVLMSASFCCFSGTQEAFLYDSLKELGTERDMTAHNGRLRSAENFLNIFLPFVGAWVAKDLLESQFHVLIGFQIVAMVASFVIFLFLLEPRHVKQVAKEEKGILRE